MKQDYVLKKYVRAESASEALRLDDKSPVSEVFLAADKPDRLAEALGFKTVSGTVQVEE